MREYEDYIYVCICTNLWGTMCVCEGGGQEYIWKATQKLCLQKLASIQPVRRLNWEDHAFNYTTERTQVRK